MVHTVEIMCVYVCVCVRACVCVCVCVLTNQLGIFAFNHHFKILGVWKIRILGGNFRIILDYRR